MRAKEKLYKHLPRPKLNRTKINEIYQRLQNLDPAPRTELNYTNVFTLVVAVALSAQSTDIGVNKATKRLFELADTPQKMMKLGENTIRDHIKTIGLYKTKARNVVALSKMLIKEFNSNVPSTNVVLNDYFGQPTMAVDTHIFRVSNRTGMAPGKDPVEVELNLLRVTGQKYINHAHHWLILLGRYTCIARKPKCYNCPVNDLCSYKSKTLNPES
jgi:endonuclease-3